MLVYSKEVLSFGDLKRLISKGSNGQDAGKGRNGDDGVIHLPQPGEPGYVGYPGPGYAQLGLPPGTVYTTIDSSGGDASMSGEGGNKRFPDDGEPAQPAGKPGEPGNGGQIVTDSAEVAKLAETSPGKSGGAGTVAIGGAPGTPVHSYWIARARGNINRVIRENEAKKGDDAPPPQALHSEGEPGDIRVLHSSGGLWVRPETLQMHLAYVKDLYISGHYDLAARALREQLNSLDTSPVEDTSLSAQVEAARLEMRVLAERLANNLDYFGNPAGWTPMLSLEITVSAFDSEIDNSIQAMATKQWFDTHQSTIAARNIALQRAASIDSERVTANRNALSKLQDNLQQLGQEARKLAGQTRQVEKNIQAEEDSLEIRAREGLEDKAKVRDWQSNLAELGELCKVIPVFQPQLGKIGSGITSISDLGKAHYRGALENLSSAWRPETEKAFQESRDQLIQLVDALDLASETSISDRLQVLGPIAKKMGDAISILERDAEQRQVPESDVDAELKRLRAQRPQLGELIAQIEALNAEKEVVTQLIGRFVSQAASLSSNIVSDIVAIDSMRRERSANLEEERPEIDLLFKQLDSNARDRLLKYHYYVAKAYEYRLVKPYTKRLKLDAYATEIDKTMGDSSLDAALEPKKIAALRVIYESNLSAVTADLIKDYEDSGARRVAVIHYPLQKDELATLAATDHVSIDLMRKGLVSSGYEDVRITGIEIYSGKVSFSGSNDITPNTVVSIEHSLSSRIRSRGILYEFRQSNPAVWGATIYGAEGKPEAIHQLTPSHSESSLLLTLLHRASGNYDQNPAVIFAEPAAWSELNLKMETIPKADGIKISDLELSISEDYRSAPTTEALLQVYSLPNIATHFDIVTHEEQSTAPPSRVRGRGDFFRVYAIDTKLTIRAAPTSGRYKFFAWRENGATGPILSQNARIDVTLHANKALFLEYRLVQ
jgi:hypothetical protein